MYLQYTYSASFFTAVKAAGTPIFQLSMSGLAYNNATCNYTVAGGATVASCPPSNCQLATCNSKNVQADFGAECVPCVSRLLASAQRARFIPVAATARARPSSGSRPPPRSAAASRCLPPAGPSSVRGAPRRGETAGSAAG